MRRNAKRKTQNAKLRLKTKSFIFGFLFFIFSLFTFYFALYTICFAQPVSSKDLIEHAKNYDGKEVSFQGEVVGDVMVRANTAWVNINDRINAIGVFCPSDLVKPITHKGGYGIKGDVVLVTGVFHRACRQHGGDLDIHAKDLKRIEEGKVLKEAVSREEGLVAFVFILIAFIVFIMHSLFIHKITKGALKKTEYGKLGS